MYWSHWHLNCLKSSWLLPPLSSSLGILDRWILTPPPGLTPPVSRTLWASRCLSSIWRAYLKGRSLLFGSTSFKGAVWLGAWQFYCHLSNEDVPEASLVPHLHLDRREHIHLRSVVLLNSSRLLVQPELSGLRHRPLPHVLAKLVLSRAGDGHDLFTTYLIVIPWTEVKHKLGKADIVSTTGSW